MRQKKCFFVGVIAWCWFAAFSLYGQNTAILADTLAEMRLRNIIVLPPRTVEFELVLTNRSPSSLSSPNAWQRWANGTFFLKASNLTFAGAALELDSAGVQPEKNVNILQQGRAGYEVRTVVQAERRRCAIVIIGTDSAASAVLLPPDSSLVLGRFRLTCADTLQNPEQVRLSWLLPLERFQANAFKTEQSRTVRGKIYTPNDNCEMLTSYQAEIPTVERPPEMTASGLQAEYIGDKRVRLRWTTLEERTGRRTNAGFVLLRQAVKSSPINSSFDTVATFLRTPALRLRGASSGAEYMYSDSVPKRGEIYAYRLGFWDATVRAVQEFRVSFPQDTVRVEIPNAIIAEAVAQPNPFGETALVRYVLLDRARVTAYLYDVAGRIVRPVLEDAERPRGVYSFVLDGTSLPNQAAYFLVFTALPVNDTALERSQATVKVQLSR